MPRQMGVWTFRHLAEGLLRNIRRSGYSYDAAFRMYERSSGIDPTIRRTAYLAGRDFVSRYYTLVHAADSAGMRRDPRVLADLWIYYFGGGFLDEGERKRYSKKIARMAARGRLADLDELLDGLDRVGRISVELSYPRWLVNELVSAMGDEAAAMLRALNEEHRWLRVNLSLTDVDSAIEALRAEGLSVRKHERLEYMLRVVGYEGALSDLKAVAAGYVVPQDLGSALVAEELDEDDGILLDACSAPGGKAAIVLMRRRSMILGCDLSRRRLAEESRLLRRWGLADHRLSLAVCDSTRLSLRRFDQSLLDAPCTNSGDVGRNPAVKLMLENRGIAARYARLQRALLRSVLRSTRELLVYSTCSILPEEGELIVQDLERAESRLGLPSGYWGVGNRIYPHIHDSGGFFVSRIRASAPAGAGRGSQLI
ncbi:MAG: RsmB/NOP family class I SAM-dependent RNA methyltransferase [Nitrososphaeria archaeon]